MMSDNLCSFSGREANIPPMLVHDFSLVEVSNLLHISQSLVSHIVDKISKTIATHHQEFTNFPTPNEIATAKYKFSNRWTSQGNWNNRLYPQDMLSRWSEF